MPKPYVSNSPKYLDYIASTMTREEILADENLCKLLNNPYIKDNMETALAWAEAEVGGFEEKFQFVKQFLCNGPELDTDTIIHYRDIILNDEDYSFIANTYFSNIEVVDDYRVNEFNKETASTSGNCLLNPCNYLDDLSLNLGVMGDPRNFRTIENLFALKMQVAQDKKENNEENDKNPRSQVDSDTPQGAIRPNITGRLPQAVQRGYAAMNAATAQSYSNFAEEIANSNIPIGMVSVGDCNAIRNCEAISSMVKMNIFQNLGDCARLWSDLRNLNYYNPEQNTVQPVKTEVANKTVEGTPIKKPAGSNDYKAANPKAKAKVKQNILNTSGSLTLNGEALESWYQPDNIATMGNFDFMTGVINANLITDCCAWSEKSSGDFAETVRKEGGADTPVPGAPQPVVNDVTEALNAVEVGSNGLVIPK